MRRLGLLTFTLLACSGRAVSPGHNAKLASRTGDSVVLERTRCFGTCPAYRLSIGRSGAIAFSSEYPVAVQRRDSAPYWAVDSLYDEAARSGLFALPDTILGSIYCPVIVTDHSTISLSLFGPRTKHIVYYTGCYPQANDSVAVAHRNLRQIAERIDSLVGARRWYSPARH